MSLPNTSTDIIQCPNYRLCGHTGTAELFSCSNNRCIDCDAMFGEYTHGNGNLEFKIIDECCICYDENLSGSQMGRCNHFLCITCNKKLYKAGEIFGDSDEPFKEYRCPLCRK